MNEPGYRQSVLEAVVETVPDGILVVDKNRQFFTYNQQFVDMWGIPDDVVASGDDQRAIESVLAELERPNEFLQTVEYFYDNPDETGHELIHLSDGRTFERYTAPAKDDDGTYYGRIWVFSDVTSRKQYEKRLRALNEAARRLVTAETMVEVADVTVDVAADVLDQPLTALWRYESDEEQLVPLAATDTADDLDESQDTADEIGTIPPDTTEMQVFHKGEPTLIENYQQMDAPAHPETPLGTLLLVPMDGHGQLHVGSCVVEEFDPATRELIEILARNATAAFERVQREQELRDRERELERQNERLNEFANIVSHDLRNPLTVASGRLSLAREECDSEHFDAIEDALERMNVLIEDTLSLARQGKTIDEKTSVSLEDAVEEAWERTDTATATLEVADDLATVHGDADRIQELLENLFRNAVEHGGENVTIRVGRSNDGFYVADDGPGVPEGDRRRVFDHGFTTSDRGTGFGLAIVERIAEAHGWNVTVTDSESGGARFEFTVG
ncbi:PAS domain-containing sensor histidine kinase [Halorarius halobius]|uniref:PAS domain-containing sensor histidine kinase n=1 Tax=Halorarius halobius TaxID=2962671 RepID=UPI0020CDABB5|nr:ATP-binding protein [Halorarius halobius]